MRRVVLLGVLLVLAVGVPEAEAAKRLLGKELAAAVPISVIHDRCPENLRALACAYAPERLIYIWVLGPRYRNALEHERGHIYSYWNLTAEERNAIKVEAGWSRWREERFADAFAACRLSSRQQEKAKAQKMALGPLQPNVCRLIGAFA
jgi:hypothetical protein